MPRRPREFAFTEDDFHALRALVHRVSGISLADSKRGLVYGRLAGRLRALKMDSFAQYRELLDIDPKGAEMAELMNAITTNLTSFFRESHHFEYLRQHLMKPASGSRRHRRVRIWSAGCSTGEEPYSIAMTVYEALGEASNADLKILATDLDSNVLAHARAGVYSDERVVGISAARMSRFFDQQYDDASGSRQHVVKSDTARLITFKQLNLIHELPMHGPLDAIFCRNVVIYFDKDTQRDLFQRYARLQRPGDLLFIGHSESMHNRCEAYTLIGRTIYRRNETNV